MDFCQKIFRYLCMQLESDSSLLRSKSELKPCITAQQRLNETTKIVFPGLTLQAGAPVRSRSRPTRFFSDREALSRFNSDSGSIPASETQPSTKCAGMGYCTANVLNGSAMSSRWLHSDP